MKAKKSDNRNSWNRIILVPVFALTAVMLTSCDKENNDISFGSLEGTYVLTIDHDETTYQYPYYSSGIVIFRGNVPKSYSLRNLAGEKDCAWKIVRNSGYSAQAYYSFQSHSSREIWWSVGTTYGIGGSPEFYLGTEESDSAPDNESERFIIHEFSRSDGGKEIVIESLAHRGHYIENIGHTLTGNGLRLISKNRPGDATRFRLNGNVVGSTIEGI